MTKVSPQSFLILIAVFLYVNTVDGCVCVQPHPQLTFCQADVVFMGRVTKGKQIEVPPGTPQVSLKYEYEVEVKQKIKNKKKIDGVVKIESPCGVQLKLFHKYILSASIKKNRKLEIGRCSLKFEEKDMSFEQMQYIYSTKKKTSYGKNCGCKNFCQPKFKRKPECYFKPALCRKKKKRCEWKNDDDDCGPTAVAK